MISHKKLKQWFVSFTGSIWLFPVLVITIFSLLVIFRVNGSSIGIYNQAISGESHDPNLLLGKSRSIRSDEWLVTTQMVIAQKEAGYPAINTNIGNGQDMDILLDVPAKDWSQIFRPQNHAFFMLPFENAFAYRWWFSGVILVLAVYFLSLFFLPKRRLFASLIAIAAFFSPFFQWWYINTTLSCVAYGIVIFLLFANLITTDKKHAKVLLSMGLSYALISFAILLYPPFQIPCAIAIFLLAAGYMWYLYPGKGILSIVRKYWLYFACIIIGVIGILGVYLYQNRTVINIVQNTAYPGKRVVESGGYSITHLLSGHLALKQLTMSSAIKYNDTQAGVANQSETSSFLFISLFLIAPILFIFLNKKTRKIYRPYRPVFICVAAIYAIFLGWLFIPNLPLLGAITKLNTVPQNRLIIGLGLINIVTVILFAWIYARSKYILSIKQSIIFSVFSLSISLLVSVMIYQMMPGFISLPLAIALAFPLPIIEYLWLRKHFELGAGILVAFSLIGGALVNPLYVGLGSAVNNPLISAIKEYPGSSGRWITEDGLLENTPFMAAKPALTGVFAYPQNSIWKVIDNGNSEDVYNRYAHVTYNIDRDPSVTVPTGFAKSGPDQLIIRTEICSSFLHISGVRHIITSGVIPPTDMSCVTNTKIVSLPQRTYYIYTIQ